MPIDPSENDLAYNTYGLDIEGIFRFLYEKLTANDWDALASSLGFWWSLYSIVAILFSLLFLAGFIYAKIKYDELSAIEQKALHEAEAKWALAHEGGDGAKNTRWESIQKHIMENSPEAWRIAIIEADIMLDETLREAGYAGQSIGEMLKSANTQSFKTVQDAWDAHKVRNDIAHVGSDFVLTKRTAQETIMHFERVFREFGVI
jgi:hypothetical protein